MTYVNDELHLTTIMQGLKDRKSKLVHIKNELTPQYLASAVYVDLEAKLALVNSEVKLHDEIWNKTNWEDLPDDETVGYEGAKEEIHELRDEIKAMIEPRLAQIQTQLGMRTTTPIGREKDL